MYFNICVFTDPFVIYYLRIASRYNCVAINSVAGTRSQNLKHGGVITSKSLRRPAAEIISRQFFYQ